ncbi:MAG TPA: hypothetical protein GX696_11215 [Pseudomonadaceae bacterium]|nr:hypothetical protein [Pseudomonadaceae bacterium]
MKRASHMLALCCLVVAPFVVQADDRFNNRSGSWASVDRLQWQLGKALGWNRGYQILYRNSGSARWQLAPGTARAVADGWVLGNDRAQGGYSIYRWNGHGWSRMPGAATRIGGSYHAPWVINDRGVRYEWTGRDWREDRGRREQANAWRSRDRGHDRNRGWDRDRDRNRGRSDNRGRR